MEVLLIYLGINLLFLFLAFPAKAIETGMILLNMDMKNQLLCFFFHRPIFTEIREFAAIVLWMLAVFNCLGRLS